MAYDKVIDSALLDAGMTATANAIRAKTGGTSPIMWDSADGFRGAVEAINTEGGVELPELNEPAEPGEVFSGQEYIDGDGQKKTGSFTIDEELTEQDSLITQIANALKNKAAGSLITLPELTNPAAPTDMVAGKELYDDEGNPVTGTLVEADEIQERLFATSDYSFGGTPGGTVFHVGGKYNGNIDGVVVRPGAGLGVRNAPTEFFGNATADQVAKGATFTSAAGLLVEGTHECEDGVTLPVLSNPAIPRDLAVDKQLIDGGGNIVTGELYEVPADAYAMAPFETLYGNPGATAFSVGAVFQKNLADGYGAIIRKGAILCPRNIPVDLFGTAATNQVAKGVTFTSAAGLLMEGGLEDIPAGRAIGASEDVTVTSVSDGTIRIRAKTNWGDEPGCIVRSGAYLSITAPISAFYGIFGDTDDVTIDGETLVLGANSTATIENETLIL